MRGSYLARLRGSCCTATRVQWWRTFWRRGLQASRRVTMQLLPERLVTGAAPQRVRKAW
jgi:hypothetical protein